MTQEKTNLNNEFEKKYDSKEQEKAILNFWDTNETYKFNAKSSKVVFSIDTPPPTISGKMHLGHAFSYTQTDFIARYKRMKGFEVFYPFGTDDNGLATEKLVQKEKNVDLRKMTREEAVKITMEYLEEKRPGFIQDWRNLGISCDFENLKYSTISPYSQKISQESFLKLVDKGLIQRRKGPVPWDRVFQTTIAQAELEDKEVKSKMNYIKAKVVNSQNTYIIYATTRPEMIFACHGFSVEDSGDYVKLKVNNDGVEEYWILGSQTYQKVMSLMNSLVPETKIKNIILDVDGVIIKNSEKVKQDCIRNYLIEKGLNETEAQDIEFGINREEILRNYEIKLSLNFKESLDELNSRIKKVENKFQFNEQLIKFIKKNKDNYNFYTNTASPKDLIKRVFEKKGIYELFEKHLTGEKTKKENLKELFSKINPKESIFFDDYEKHIITAKELNTHTHHVTQEFDVEKIISNIEKESAYEVVEKLKGQDLINEKVIIPLINREIEITHDQSIKADLGTGCAYFCSFGGAEDIEYIKRHPDIPIHEIMNKDGTLNELCGDCEGLIASEEGRFAVMKKLKESKDMVAQETINQIVNVGERSGVPVEYIASEQWFVKYIDQKERFFEQAEKFNWYPKFMKSRIENWIKGLSWDWGFVRQRHFGIPIPAWINTKTNSTVFPTKDMLPIDPTQTPIPKNLCEKGFKPEDYIGEVDVLDTWFTSASSPIIATNLVEKDIQSIKLDIKLNKQLHKNDCNPSSIQAVLKYFNIKKDYDEILKQVEYTDKGVWTPIAAKVLDEYNLLTEFHTKSLKIDHSLKELDFYKNNVEDFEEVEKKVNLAFERLSKSEKAQTFEKTISLDEIINKINTNTTAIILLDWGIVKGYKDRNPIHSVVISGYDEENIYVMDNEENSHLKISKETFEKARKSKGTDEDIIFISNDKISSDKPKLFPMSLRPQGHDIINFWLFYTMAKNNLIYDQNPFNDLTITGWVLAPDGTKMSKSKGNTINPQDIVDQFSNDSLRFAAATAKLGQDLPYQEKEVKTGVGIVNKIYNATKFASMLLENFTKDMRNFNIEELNGVDQAIISKMQHVAKESTEAFEQYEYSKAKSLWTEFFMNDIADNYLEIVKQRLWKPDEFGKEECQKAQKALYYVLFNSMKGLSPIMPFITEVVYQKFFKQFEEVETIHISSYPELNIEFINSEIEELYHKYIEIVSSVRRFKAEKQISLKESLEEINVSGSKELVKFVNDNIQDLRNVTNTQDIILNESEKFKINLK